jgi:hypothetical protein
MRVIQYAAASRFIAGCSGILGRPDNPGDDDCGFGVSRVPRNDAAAFIVFSTHLTETNDDKAAEKNH